MSNADHQCLSTYSEEYWNCPCGASYDHKPHQCTCGRDSALKPSDRPTGLYVVTRVPYGG